MNKFIFPLKPVNTKELSKTMFRKHRLFYNMERVLDQESREQVLQMIVIRLVILGNPVNSLDHRFLICKSGWENNLSEASQPLGCMFIGMITCL